MKRVIALFLVALICIGLVSVTASASGLPFSDMKPGAYYVPAVRWAVENNITKGISATEFGPDDICTRGQVVTFLWRAFGSPEPESSNNPFVDVKSNAFYYKAVLWAVENNITAGTSKNTFSPDAACTRGQVVTFLWRAKGKPDTDAKNSFVDVSHKAFYYDAVLWAVEAGVTNGVGKDRFAPEDPCTRGQIVTFLYRAMSIKEPEESPVSIAIPGYEGITLQADTKQQTLTLANPAQNACYFRIELYLEDGTLLWRSGLIAPGESSAPMVLREELEKGTYPNALLRYNCYKMNNKLSTLNVAETKLTLWVK